MSEISELFETPSRFRAGNMSAPLGPDLSGETPAEIALAAIAETQATLVQRSGTSFRAVVRQEQKGTEARLVRAEDSHRPRPAGRCESGTHQWAEVLACAGAQRSSERSGPIHADPNGAVRALLAEGAE